MEDGLLQEKYECLQQYLQEAGSAAIAFSSGVDSTFLLKVAHDVLGERAVAVTLCSAAIPVREAAEAAQFCRKEGIHHIICEVNADEIPGFRENPANRCYLCKKALFSRLQQVAAEEGLACVAEGSNMDDLGDYRPGMQAIRELGIASPLQKAGLYKSEIRELSRRLELPTWKKKSFACLATRFPYGEPITTEGLTRVDRAEEFLFQHGFEQFRVRMHGRMARIELLPEDIGRAVAEPFRTELVAYFEQIGFQYVSLDLKGYRTGSMNETLKLDRTEP